MKLIKMNFRSIRNFNAVTRISKLNIRDYSSQPSPNETTESRSKVTLETLHHHYLSKKPITMMTAHDFPTGLWVENSNTDMVLVGDSLGMVALGYDSTTPVTMEVMVHHASAVSRACKASFKVVDLPFGSYERRPLLALENSIRLIKEANMEAVKLEGGVEQVEVVEAIVQAGIPVVGHIGLTPQKQVALGGFKVQGKTADKAIKLVEDALALQEAGCSSIVLECIPTPIAQYITQLLEIPTIGIGSGLHTSGQVLVQLDTLGIFKKFTPKFCKLYADLGSEATQALMKYNNEVERSEFPSKEFEYSIKKAELDNFLKAANKRFGDLNDKRNEFVMS